jgi:hypothetical protein
MALSYVDGGFLMLIVVNIAITVQFSKPAIPLHRYQYISKEMNNSKDEILGGHSYLLEGKRRHSYATVMFAMECAKM